MIRCTKCHTSRLNGAEHDVQVTVLATLKRQGELSASVRRRMTT
jgi:hypothetical protein